MRRYQIISFAIVTSLFAGGFALAQTAVDKSKVLATNIKFYTAFTAGDLESMKEVWSAKQKIGMTPPGAAFLEGGKQIFGTFAIMMARPFPVRCEVESFEFKAKKAVVICDEILENGSVKMMNVFAPEGDGDEKDWKMLYHGPVPEGWTKT